MDNQSKNIDEHVDEMVKGLEPLIQSMKALNNEAVAAYAPLVDDICSQHATLKEVEHLLDYMLGFAGDDRVLLLFKRVCRAYWQTYPEDIAWYIMEYRKWYDPESLVGTEYEYLLDEIGYWDKE